MYCPRCGQERIEDRTIFCSRCGLLLDHLEEVMENGGEPLFESQVETGLFGRIFSRKNVRIVALLWFIFATILLLPIMAIMGAPEELLGIMGLMGPVGALTLLLLSFFISKPVTRGPRRKRRTEKNSQANAEPRELPPDRTVYASDFVPPPAHGEEDARFASRRPPSVTEDTTRHLKLNDEE